MSGNVEYFKDYMLEADIFHRDFAIFAGRLMAGEAAPTLPLIPRKVGSFPGTLTHDGLAEPMQRYEDTTSGLLEPSHPNWVAVNPADVTARYRHRPGMSAEGHVRYTTDRNRVMRYLYCFSGTLSIKGLGIADIPYDPQFSRDLAVGSTFNTSLLVDKTTPKEAITRRDTIVGVQIRLARVRSANPISDKQKSDQAFAFRSNR